MRPDDTRRRDKIGILVALATLWGVVSIASASSPPDENGVESDGPAGVTADGLVVWDPERNHMLVETDPAVARPMASTTKLMTALIAVERVDIDEMAMVPPQAPDTVEGNNVAHIGLRHGDEVPVSGPACRRAPRKRQRRRRDPRGPCQRQ